MKKYFFMFLFLCMLPVSSSALVSPDIVVWMSGALAAFISIFSFAAIFILSFFRKIRKFFMDKKNRLWKITFLLLFLALLSMLFLSSSHEESSYDDMINLFTLPIEQKGKAESLSSLDVELFNSTDYLFVDVREDRELEEFSVRGLKHIRLADLLSSSSGQDLFQNKKLVFSCFSGERARIAADYFVHKGFEASFLEKGLYDFAQNNPDLIEGEISETVSIRNDNIHLYPLDVFNDLVQQNPIQTLDFRDGAKEKYSFFSRESRELSAEKKSRKAKNIFIICDSELSCFDMWASIPHLRSLGLNPIGFSYGK